MNVIYITTADSTHTNKGGEAREKTELKRVGVSVVRVLLPTEQEKKWPKVAA